MIKKKHLSISLIALVAAAACGKPPTYKEEAKAAAPTEFGSAVAPLQHTGSTEHTGVSGTFRAYQNPANDCSNLGSLIMEEPTEVTQAGLSLALLGVPTSNQDPQVCTSGTKYCLELMDGWTMSSANLGATLTDPNAWTLITDTVELVSPNPMPIEVCEGLTTEVNLMFNRGENALILGVGRVDVSLELMEIGCGGECGTTATNVGDPVCTLYNSLTNVNAEASCVPSCEVNADCPNDMLCVGGNTPFPTDNPGVCYGPA